MYLSNLYLSINVGLDVLLQQEVQNKEATLKELYLEKETNKQIKLNESNLKDKVRDLSSEIELVSETNRGVIGELDSTKSSLLGICLSICLSIYLSVYHTLIYNTLISIYLTRYRKRT
jgi:hypothetical protein